MPIEKPTVQDSFKGIDPHSFQIMVKVSLLGAIEASGLPKAQIATIAGMAATQLYDLLDLTKGGSMNMESFRRVVVACGLRPVIGWEVEK